MVPRLPRSLVWVYFEKRQSHSYKARFKTSGNANKITEGCSGSGSSEGEIIFDCRVGTQPFFLCTCGRSLISPAFTPGWGGGAEDGRCTESYSERVNHLLANDAYTLPKLYLFVKNIVHCVVAKLNPSPVPTETGWLGFRVRCQLVFSGALMCQLLLQHSFYFQSPGWFYTLLLCKGIRISGSFVSEGARASSIAFELHTQGQPSRQASKLWFISHALTFSKKKGSIASGCSVGSLYGSGLGWLALPECSSQPPSQGHIGALCR